MVSLKFHCQESKEDFIEIEVKSSTSLLISVTEERNENIVNLDKSTAIKLSKELRKQIALLD
jgi:hypothetical protein